MFIVSCGKLNAFVLPVFDNYFLFSGSCAYASALFVDPLKSMKFDSSQNVQNLIRRASGFIDSSIECTICVSHVMSTSNNIDGNIFMLFHSFRNFSHFGIVHAFVRQTKQRGEKRTKTKHGVCCSSLHECKISCFSKPSWNNNELFLP